MTNNREMTDKATCGICGGSITRFGGGWSHDTMHDNRYDHVAAPSFNPAPHGHCTGCEEMQRDPDGATHQLGTVEHPLAAASQTAIEPVADEPCEWNGRIISNSHEFVDIPNSNYRRCIKCKKEFLGLVPESLPEPKGAEDGAADDDAHMDAQGGMGAFDPEPKGVEQKIPRSKLTDT